MKLPALVASTLLVWVTAGCLSLAAQAQTPVAAPAAASRACPAVLQYKFARLQDEVPQDLCQYAGKAVVAGDARNPFYAALFKTTGQAPKWNFHKYLLDRDGKVLGSYASKVTPDNATLLAAIEQALR